MITGPTANALERALLAPDWKFLTLKPVDVSIKIRGMHTTDSPQILWKSHRYPPLSRIRGRRYIHQDCSQVFLKESLFHKKPRKHMKGTDSTQVIQSEVASANTTSQVTSKLEVVCCNETFVLSIYEMTHQNCSRKIFTTKNFSCKNFGTRNKALSTYEDYLQRG